MSDSTYGDAQIVAKLAAAAIEPKSSPQTEHDESLPFVVVPDGYKIADIESLFVTPKRARGTLVVNDLGSFIAVILDNKIERTRVYGRANPTPAFSAVFNRGNSALPGWGDHAVSYPCPLSREWQTWNGSNGKSKPQADFARFIEDNAPDIINPSSAEMIEISRTLEAKKKVNFASSVRLDNGQNSVTYEEEIAGTAGKGQLQIPERFEIQIPVFEGGPSYLIDARLRFRIGDDRKLAMWYDLLRPHLSIEHAVNLMRDQIKAEVGLVVINGG